MDFGPIAIDHLTCIFDIPLNFDMKTEFILCKNGIAKISKFWSVPKFDALPFVSFKGNFEDRSQQINL